MNDARQQWMRLLALAPQTLLAQLATELGELPPQRMSREPEIGLVMVRGRIAGTGDPFNVGEMTVTRATVSVGDAVGFACIAGRSPSHARLAALIDALLQEPAWHDRINDALLVPLERALLDAQRVRNRERAATTADFVSVVRSGES